MALVITCLGWEMMVRGSMCPIFPIFYSCKFPGGGGGHSHWEVIWVCAAFMTHLFTPIYSSGDPQFQVDLQLRSPNSQFSPKKFKSSPNNRLKSSRNISMTSKSSPNELEISPKFIYFNFREAHTHPKKSWVQSM